jgi:hypothetical protein
MRDILEGNSPVGGSIGEEFNRLREAIRSLLPTDSDLLQADRTTRGTTWRPTSRLMNNLAASTQVETFTVATNNPQTITASGGTEITKPIGPRSYSDTRNTPGDTYNWRPADGSSTSIDYHYSNSHYRHAIIHVGETLLGNSPTGAGGAIDYHIQLQKLEPFYLAGDTIYAMSISGTWYDMNIAGRHWRNVYRINAVDQPRNTGENDYHDANENFITGTVQVKDQLYTTSNPAWIGPTDYSAYDIY